MTQTTKRIALICFAVALGSVILLSFSLSNLRLHDGLPFPGGGNSLDPSQPVPTPASGSTFSSTMLKGILDIILLILLISVPARLIPFVNMKRLLQVLFVVTLLLLLANLISHLPGSQPVHLPGEPSGISTQPSSEYPVSPLGQPPQGIVWFVLIGVVFGAGFLAIKLLSQWQPTKSVEDQLSQEAESALHSIKVGEDLRSVILRCYLQMSRALQDEQGIERSENMTVHEFEDWLAAKGFPKGPVQQLSRLYEKGRYSQQEIFEEDENIAIKSLQEIIQFCRIQRKRSR